jgi:hypothetical protein
MSQSFVWFHNSSDNPSDSSTFYQKLLGWTASEGSTWRGLTSRANGGCPFARLSSIQRMREPGDATARHWPSCLTHTLVNM